MRSPNPERRQIRARGALLGLACLASAASGALGEEWAVLGHPTTRDLGALSFVDARHGWAAGDSGTILVTTDGGVNWRIQGSPVAFDIVDIEMIDESLGWALAQQVPGPPNWEYGTTLIRTTDGGEDWFVQSTFPDLFVHALAFTGPLQGCLGGEQGNLWWTSDGGVQWTPALVDSAESARWPIREITFHTPTYGLATGGLYDVTGLVWRTTDGGQSWTHQRVAGEPFFGIHFFDSLNVVCVGGDLDYGAGMVRTSNAGAQWQYTYLGIWGRASAVSFRTPQEGWAPLGFAGTLMRSRDGGAQWDEMPSPEGTAMLDVVFLDAGTGYMVGAGGTILRYVGDGSAVGAPDGEARGPALVLQTHPNPFGPRARVDFRVPRAGRVSLTIHDVLGREVARLVDGSLAGGAHSRTFDGERLPSGVYFCRLVAENGTATRKMLLVR